MKITDRFTSYPGGVPLTAKDVELLLHDGVSPLQTVATDSGGFVTFTANGSPGIIRWVLDDAGEIREIFGNISPQIGHLYGDEIPEILRLFENAVVNGMAITAPGGMFARVGTGSAIGDQNIHVQYTVANVAIGANASGSTRTDLVYCYIGGATSAEPWETYNAVIAAYETTGAAALTAKETTGAVIRLAEIALPSGASAVTTGMITDLRTFSTPAMADHSVTLDKLHAGGASNGESLVYNAGSGDWEPGNAGRTFQKRGTSETDVTISGTTLVKLLELTFPALPEDQSYTMGITGWVNAEGANGGLVDGTIGIKIEDATTVQSGTARWEGGVDSTQHHELEVTKIGRDNTFLVSLWARRISGQNMNVKRCGMYILATPV